MRRPIQGEMDKLASDAARLPLALEQVSRRVLAEGASESNPEGPEELDHPRAGSPVITIDRPAPTFGQCSGVITYPDGEATK